MIGFASVRMTLDTPCGGEEMTSGKREWLGPFLVGHDGGQLLALQRRGGYRERFERLLKGAGEDVTGWE